MVNLVIMESAAKCKKAKSYLGKDYECISSQGHCIDLPARKFSIDLKNNFEPTYGTIPGKGKILSEILSKAKKAETVYLMSDPDREGEAIAWHLANKLTKKTKYKRAKTNEITKQAIIDAVQNAGDIDIDLVESYETRRILDRLVGYRCSYPVKQATGGNSVGRTQSAGLRILGEREWEIQRFVPQQYWTIEGVLLNKSKEDLFVSIKKPKPLDIDSEKFAKEILTTFKKGPIVVSKFEDKIAKQRPLPPFATSTLQQAASTYLGMSPKRTMRAAQKLYEMGHITYHRTDSLTIAKTAMGAIRGFVKDNFDAKYLPAKMNFYKNKSKNAQEAHEAVRPTNIKKQSINGEDDFKRLYDLIWRRTIASQMTPAEFARRSAEFTCGDYKLGANGNKMIFNGFKKVWTYSKSEDVYLPDLKKGDRVTVKELKSIAKETKPPPRFSEASFVKKLEEEGIGRPSTYAAIIETLKARSYIEKDGRSLVTADLGLTVLEFLIKVDFCFADLAFTSQMEEKLDEIASKKAKKIPTLNKFWKRLSKDLTQCKKVHEESRITDYVCPKCGEKLERKHSRIGPFYGCSAYPKCKNIMNIGKNGQPTEKIKKEKKDLVLSDYDCPECSEKMVEREGRYGKFYGCSKFPKCRGIRNSEGELPKPKWPKKKKGASKKKTVAKKATTASKKKSPAKKKTTKKATTKKATTKRKVRKNSK